MHIRAHSSKHYFHCFNYSFDATAAITQDDTIIIDERAREQREYVLDVMACCYSRHAIPLSLDHMSHAYVWHCRPTSALWHLVTKKHRSYA
eukprot:3794-Heterococcus_DN1.PRE.5